TTSLKSPRRISHQLADTSIRKKNKNRKLVDSYVASLSGGQKSRVAFAQMTMPCPNLYILDEPTNHLDMESIEALAKALNGGVVLVSHDERLIRLVCRELWVCEAGIVHRIDGGFDEYKHILHEQFQKEGYL
uniref:ATP-binding cassette, sub-family F (GCN20), member 3 n=1 Tax=Neogobius melanostomus TaxID=47308 RepID=A0A8C6WGG2_9GOBI